jgi:hypothetical protein
LAPGIAINAVVPKHFSLTVFCFSQIVTDCETAYYLGRLTLHGACVVLGLVGMWWILRKAGRME